MIIVVIMTLARWDDRGEEMNKEEADQDVVDEVSEEVDWSGEVDLIIIVTETSKWKKFLKFSHREIGAGVEMAGDETGMALCM